MRGTRELVQHVTLWNLNSFSSRLCWCGPLHLAFLGEVADACTNIQQVAFNKKKEKNKNKADAPLGAGK